MAYNLSKEDLEERIKQQREAWQEKEAQLKARLERYTHRDKALKELRVWLQERDLERSDVLWFYQAMAPKQAAKPVATKKPLHPAARELRGHSRGTSLFGTAKHEPKGDATFRTAIREARHAKNWTLEEVGARVGVSSATVQNWESGRNVATSESRLKILRLYGLPLDLGKAASEEMEATRKAAAGHRGNGVSADTP